MQTFLISPTYEDTAKVLDNKRLNKQVVEGYQLKQALTQRRLVTTVRAVGPRGGKIRVDLPQSEWRLENGNVGWGQHPATKMWTDAAEELQRYIEVMAEEWQRRGGRATAHVKSSIVLSSVAGYMKTDGQPRWIGAPGFHEAMRANLLRKDPEHYGQFGWTEEPAEGYVWPV